MWDERGAVFRVREIAFGLGLPIGVGLLIGWQPWVGMVAVIVVLAIAASGWLQARREVKKFPEREEEVNPIPPKDGTLKETYWGLLVWRLWSVHWNSQGNPEDEERLKAAKRDCFRLFRRWKEAGK